MSGFCHLDLTGSLRELLELNCCVFFEATVSGEILPLSPNGIDFIPTWLQPACVRHCRCSDVLVETDRPRGRSTWLIYSYLQIT
jgi:hypothetical protein